MPGSASAFVESHDLTAFTLADMVQLGRSLRAQAEGCRSVEQLAQRVTSHLFATLRSAAETGEQGTELCQSVLVRCYLTTTADTVRQLTGIEPTPAPAAGRSDRYLSLFASCGLLPAWNDRRTSVAHQALALDAEALAGTPMIAALLHQLGVPEGAFSAASRLATEHPEDVHFGVFHVPEAEGSPHIPDQDFVRDYGVRSAVGFGGLLPSGELFAVVMFLRVPVSAATASLFRTVSLNVRLGLLELDRSPLVDESEAEPADVRRDPRGKRARIVRAERAMLAQLLAVHEQTTITEAERAGEALRRWQAEAQRSATLARTLQDSLLPAALPEIAGLEVAGVFRPAGDGSEVGGDFYDVFATGRRTAWFVVGDVSGKGAQAAALTSLARYTLRAVTSSTLATPATALARLNDAVLADDAERHLTAVVGTLSVIGTSVHVSLALAGHPPAILLPADGPPQEIGVPGTALGLFAAIEVTQVNLVLGPGDALLMFTDGVTEGRHAAGGFYGEQRLADLVSRIVGLPLAQLPEAVAEDVLAYQDNWASDDIAIIALGAARSIPVAS
jgi:serine phosphatase RsbU (regulator of sigma subunit)